MSLPLVSIVTPSFNQARFLEETLQSVLRQDYPDIEHIVVDGGSMDGSVEIIRKYERHLSWWVSEPDRGQTHAINKGFARSRGEVLSWLNADDVLAPSAVRIAVRHLRRDRRVGLVYGDRLHIDSRGNVVRVYRGSAFYRAMLSRNITLPQETAFFRRNVFEQVGRLDEDLHFSMDFDLWCRMAQVTRIRHISAFLGCFREHANSKSVVCGQQKADDPDGYLNEHARVFRRHFGQALPGPVRSRIYRCIHKGHCLAESWRRRRPMEMSDAPANCESNERQRHEDGRAGYKLRVINEDARHPCV